MWEGREGAEITASASVTEKCQQSRGHLDLNQGPLDLQSNALPLSYTPRPVFSVNCTSWSGHLTFLQPCSWEQAACPTTAWLSLPSLTHSSTPKHLLTSFCVPDTPLSFHFSGSVYLGYPSAMCLAMGSQWLFPPNRTVVPSSSSALGCWGAEWALPRQGSRDKNLARTPPSRTADPLLLPLPCASFSQPPSSAQPANMVEK